MVASISARGSAPAALAYYDHLRSDGYYMRSGEPPGRWAGRAAERLSLQGPVTEAEFEAALSGTDPKTGERLVRHRGQSRPHAAGWDMTFSAPKSASVLWALSNESERQAIAHAHRFAVLAATAHLERNSAWARRGRAGSLRERTAGLLMAQFDHHTSRESDPQLHTHSFVFNLAPRWDGSWGAIVSRELYKAQKEAGTVYRGALAGELERLGYRLDRDKEGFRVIAIPREIERAFSKRRQAIEEAARAHGYRTPRGMELATLRTRSAKRETNLEGLFKAWQTEATALGFELGRAREQASLVAAAPARFDHAAGSGRVSTPSRPAQTFHSISLIQRSVAQLGSQLGQVLRTVSQRSAMPGISLRLRRSDRERERE
jgi:conjugative relaxase-like TrwC/TraI family protein